MVLFLKNYTTQLSRNQLGEKRFMKVIITGKPILAISIAAVLGAKKRQDG